MSARVEDPAAFILGGFFLVHHRYRLIEEGIILKWGEIWTLKR
jgi:hypothetical protein